MYLSDEMIRLYRIIIRIKSCHSGFEAGDDSFFDVIENAAASYVIEIRVSHCDGKLFYRSDSDTEK